MRSLTRTLLILPLVVASLAYAADKPKKEGGFGGKPTGPLLTKEQLRACFAQRDAVAKQDDELKKEEASITETKAQITRVGDDLKARLETVDRSNAEQIAAYNDAVQARDQQIDDYQARVAAFNTKVEQNASERESFQQKCSNRRYLEDDEAALRKGK